MEKTTTKTTATMACVPVAVWTVIGVLLLCCVPHEAVAGMKTKKVVTREDLDMRTVYRKRHSAEEVDTTTQNVQATPPQRPSFIIFLADDLGYGDVTYYGAPTTATPNIDRFLREGKDFRQFYAAASVCSPSRAGLLTGREPVRMGMFSELLPPALRVFFPWTNSSLSSNETTIAHTLKRANYSSHFIGKWHLGHVNALPTKRGFDDFFGLPYSHDMSSEVYGLQDLPVLNRLVPPMPLMRGSDIVQQPVDFSTATDRFTEDAIRFINEKGSEPFFLVMSYYQPHVPHVPPYRFHGSSLRGPFGDSVSEMDASIGRIMRAVRDANIDDSTMMMLASDNGPWVDSGLAGGSPGVMKGSKGTTWEGGMRVMGAFRWPGVIAPATIEHVPASMLDVHATLAQIAGVNIERNANHATDSHSFAHVLNPAYASGLEHRFAIYYFYQNVLMAVRMGPYKMHKYTRCAYCYEKPVAQDPPLLFNIDEDPGEQHPLDPRDYPLVTALLQEEYDRYQASIEPRQALFDDISLFAAPCCSPTPFLRPCNCTNTTLHAGQSTGGQVIGRSAKSETAAQELQEYMQRVHDPKMADHFTPQEVLAALDAVAGSPMERAITFLLERGIGLNAEEEKSDCIGF